MMSSHADRASKSITSLRTLAEDSLDHNPDQLQSFQLNINTVMTELQSRSERVQSLEAELIASKKEMESKQTIITGLTRERGSLKASLGVDFSVVSQMREQLLEGENQIRALQEQHAGREREFQGQIDSLKASLNSQADALPTPREDKFMNIPGGFAFTSNDESDDRQVVGGAAQVRSDDIAK